MIYAFGDSHMNFYLKNIPIHIENLFQPSITMHRIGRDNKIINFQESFNNKNNTFLLCYGEVDCRCHINKQVEKGFTKQEVCETLIKNYITTIKTNITEYNKIILFFIPPAVNKVEFVKYNGEYIPQHGYPTVGTDIERIENVNIMNRLLRDECNKNEFSFIDCSDFYTNDEGTIKTEYWDTQCHISNNSEIQRKIFEVLFKE
jgi:hypothetical protein